MLWQFCGKSRQTLFCGLWLCVHTHRALALRYWIWKIRHSGWQFCRRIPVLFKKVPGDLQGNVWPVNETDASIPVQAARRWKVWYIYRSIPQWGHRYFFQCCQGYFNEIGSSLMDGRDNETDAMSTLVWHDWHSTVRLLSMMEMQSHRSDE